MDPQRSKGQHFTLDLTRVEVVEVVRGEGICSWEHSALSGGGEPASCGWCRRQHRAQWKHRLAGNQLSSSAMPFTEFPSLVLLETHTLPGIL